MQHHLVVDPTILSVEESVLSAGTQPGLDRVVFRFEQLLRLVQVDCEMALRRPIETAASTGELKSQ
jgi:hypothetical protein